MAVEFPGGPWCLRKWRRYDTQSSFWPRDRSGRKREGVTGVANHHHQTAAIVLQGYQEKRKRAHERKSVVSLQGNVLRRRGTGGCQLGI